MLKEALRGAPVSSIDEVLAVMTAIVTALPDSDGLKWFNRLCGRCAARHICETLSSIDWTD